jgi:hypothetical protein
VVFELISSNDVQSKVLQADSPWFGVTYPEDKSHVVEQVRKLTEEGVYPTNLWEN